ncbi:MAG: precorrin-6A/cobalt-precorrin-6A reductase [Firmicutes bacterium]|nr:precorrin-6A/cobalt-precorrin-6A reductase [Bacillota bacterium]
MRAVIFGGTTEGRNLSLALAGEGADVVVSVASEYGAEEQGCADGITVAEGLKDVPEIRELIRGADVVIDATHPYAVLVTENIRQAAEAESIDLLRLVREKDPAELQPAEAPERLAHQAARAPGRPAHQTIDAPVHRIAADAAEAAQMALDIAGPRGRVLLTTGSKDLAVYAAVIDPENLYARVLPLGQSIHLCEEAKIPHRNIIAIQGPFSQALNEAVIRDYNIDVMVTKDSGAAGGFAEKIRACEACGIPAVVIARPREEGLSYEEVLAVCREKIK